MGPGSPAWIFSRATYRDLAVQTFMAIPYVAGFVSKPLPTISMGWPSRGWRASASSFPITSTTCSASSTMFFPPAQIQQAANWPPRTGHDGFGVRRRDCHGGSYVSDAGRIDILSNCFCRARMTSGLAREERDQRDAADP